MRKKKTLEKWNVEDFDKIALHKTLEAIWNYQCPIKPTKSKGVEEWDEWEKSLNFLSYKNSKNA